MVSEQICQGNPKNINLFLERPQATKEYGGFSWNQSVLGYNFWSDVIYNEKYYMGTFAYKCAKMLVLENQGVDSNTIRKFLSDFDKRRK